MGWEPTIYNDLVQSSTTISVPNDFEVFKFSPRNPDRKPLLFPTHLYAPATDGTEKLPGPRRRHHLLHFATKPDLVLTGIGLGINVVAGVMLPVCVLLSGEFLDAATNRDTKTVDFWCGLQALAGLVCFITSWIGTTCLEWAAENQYARAKAYYFHSLLDQDQTYKSTFDNGELPDRLMQHGGALRGALGSRLGQLTILAAQFVAGYIVALVTHWRLALVLSLMIPILLFGGGFTLWALSSSGKKIMKTYSEAASIVEECLMNMRTIISYGLEEIFLDKYDDAITKTLKVARTGALLLGLGMGFSMGSLFAFYSLGFWAQGKMMSSDYRGGCDPDLGECLTVGNGITVFFCIAFGSFALGQVATPLGALVRGRAGLEKILEVTYRSSDINNIQVCSDRKLIVRGHITFLDVGFAYKPEHVDELDTINQTMLEEASTPTALLARYQSSARGVMSIDEAQLSVQISTKRLRSIRRAGQLAISAAHRNQIAMLSHLSSEDPKRHWVFNKFNLNIAAGESVAFVGPSGCGKSTIAKLVMRFIDVSDGLIKVDGCPLTDIDIQMYRSYVGYVGQEAQLFNDSVKANIMHGCLHATMDDIIWAATMANAHGFIQNLSDGYETCVGDNGGALSGGQRQRIAIARALVRRPKILVLDEATSALDNTSEKIAFDNIKEYLKKEKCTLITIAHRLSTIQFCDKIVVFQTFSNIDVPNSRVKSFVAEIGSHDTLLRKNGLYASMVRAQNLQATSTPSPSNRPLFQSSTVHARSPLYALASTVSETPSGDTSRVLRWTQSTHSTHSTQELSRTSRLCLTSEVFKDDTAGTTRSDPEREEQERGRRPTVTFAKDQSDETVPPSLGPRAISATSTVSRKDRILSVQFAKHQFDAFKKDEEISVSSDVGEEVLGELNASCSDSEQSSSEVSFDPPHTQRSSSDVYLSSRLSGRHTGRPKLSPVSAPVPVPVPVPVSAPPSTRTSDSYSCINLNTDKSVRTTSGYYSARLRRQVLHLNSSDSEDGDVTTEVDLLGNDLAHLEFRQAPLHKASCQYEIESPKVPATVVTIDGPNYFGDFSASGVLKPSKRKAAWRFLRSDWVLVAIGLMGALGSGSIFPLFAFCFADFIGVLSVPNASYIEEGLGDPTRALLFVALGCFFAYGLQHSILELAGQRLVKRLRLELFDHIIRLPASFFDQEDLQPGYLLNLVSVDPLLVKGWALDNPALLVQNVFCVIVALIIAWMADMRLALVSLAGFVAVAPAQYLQSRFMSSEPSVVKDDKSVGTSNQILTETLRCSKTVDAFNLQKLLMRKFDLALSRERQCGRRTAFASGFFYGVAQMCQFGSQALSLWFGGRSLASGRIEDPTVMMQGTFTLIIAAMGIGQSASGATEGAKGKAAARRTQALLRVPIHPDIRDTGGLIATDVSRKHPTAKGEIKFKRLRFKFPGMHSQPVYKDLSFRLPGGKSMAVVGESGCGKTTLIQLIERFYEIPPQSQVLIGGVDIREWNLSSLRSRISLVNQEPILFNDTIYNNIRYGKWDASVSEVKCAAKMANADEFIDTQPEGYNTNVGVRGEKLSGGQRQRIALARALLKDSDILLLDEATSALDPISEKIVQTAIDKIVQETQKTVLIVAHRLSTIKNADIIVVLKRVRDEHGNSMGSIVAEVGTHDELMNKNGAYTALVMSSVADG